MGDRKPCPHCEIEGEPLVHEYYPHANDDGYGMAHIEVNSIEPELYFNIAVDGIHVAKRIPIDFCPKCGRDMRHAQPTLF